MARVLPEDRAQVTGNGQLLVGLFLLVDHALHALVDSAHFHQRILFLAQLDVVEGLEGGDHQLLEVLAPVGPLALVAEEHLGLLADRDEIEALTQLVGLGQDLDALLVLAGGMQHHSLVHQRQELVDLRTGGHFRGEALLGVGIAVCLVGLPVPSSASDVVPGATARRRSAEQAEQDRPPDRPARDRGGGDHLPYGRIPCFWNFFFNSFSSVHSSRPVRRLVSLAVIL